MGKRRLDALDAYRIVRDVIKRDYGNQRNFAKKHGLSESHLSDMMNGRSDLTPGVLRSCGLRRVVTFEPIAGV